MLSGPNERQDHENIQPVVRGNLSWFVVFLKECVHPDKVRLKATVFFSVPEVVYAKQLTMATVTADDALANLRAPFLPQSLASVRFFAGPSTANRRCDLLAFLHHISQVILEVKHVRLINGLLDCLRLFSCCIPVAVLSTCTETSGEANWIVLLGSRSLLPRAVKS